MTDKQTMFYNRLQKVYKHKKKQALRLGVTCYRVYDHDLPEFPFCIELYDDKVYLAEYLRRHGMTDDEHEIWLEECVSIVCTLLAVENHNVYIKQRKRKANRHDQYEKTGEEKQFFGVKENDFTFLINLTDYLDTGLFLDHRTTREMVLKECKDKRVQNLFAYTGSFSVYAAMGLAESVATVDLSKTYLSWAEENFKANNLQVNENFTFIHADVKQYLKSLPANSVDLTIIDPPTFSNSKRMKDILDIQRDHVELLNDVLAATTTNGIIYFSTNYSKFIIDMGSINAGSIKDITKATIPFDFDGKLKRWCYKLIK